MKVVKVDLGQRSYNIYIGKGIVERLPLFIKLETPDTPFFVITNQKISKLHGWKLKKVLKHLSNNVLFWDVPDSERAKSFPVYIKTIRYLARFARKIKPIVVAFGGGVIGDLTGFVASAYRRGVPYIQIPTTLLAQVDSAIGGKVAIDIKEAKNIVGNFYQPKIVLCDLAFLKTLPKKDLQNGLVEIVKYGIIKDRRLFSFVEKNIRKILNFNYKVLEYIISRSCSIKANIVEKDEFDTKDLRIVLNFGHTIGHAIEAASSYSKSITHGQAVARGMLAASFIALDLKMIKKSGYRKIKSLVEKVSPATKLTHLESKDILNALSYDKKFIYGTDRFILPERIGRVAIVDNVPHALIKKAIEMSLQT